MATDRKPTCIACASGGISEEKVIQLIDDNQLIAGNGVEISNKVIKSLGFIAQPSDREVRDLRPKFINSEDNTTKATLLVVVKLQFDIAAFIIPKGTYLFNTKCKVPTGLTNYGYWYLYLVDVINPPTSYITYSNQCYVTNKVTNGVVNLEETLVSLSFKYIRRDKGTPIQENYLNMTSSYYHVGLYSLEDFEE